MRKYRVVIALIVAAVIIVFGAGLLRLFLMRFGVGDVYPPYSTLRSDPLGSRVLYEALEVMPAVTVERNHQPLAQRAIDPRAALLFLGADSSQTFRVPNQLVKRLDLFVASGGRLVIAFRPFTRRSDSKSDTGCPSSNEALPPGPNDRPDNDASKRCPPPRETSADSSDAPEPIDSDVQSDSDPAGVETTRSTMALTDHWGIQIARSQTDQIQGDGSPVARLEAEVKGLPPVISWHTLAYFDQLADAWQIVYRCGGQPVVAVRRLGKGSVVFIADAYPFSNEAMRVEPLPVLLAWLIGPKQTVVFDETHHGLIHQRGVMHLVRRYNLHWLFAGAIVVALLFIWRQSFPLVPPDSGAASAPGGSMPSNRDALQAMISLLQRHIPVAELLPVCVSEWAADRRLNWRVLPDTIRQMRGRLQTVAADPVEGYRALCQMLKRKQP